MSTTLLNAAVIPSSPKDLFAESYPSSLDTSSSSPLYSSASSLASSMEEEVSDDVEEVSDEELDTIQELAHVHLAFGMIFDRDVHNSYDQTERDTLRLLALQKRIGNDPLFSFSREVPRDGNRCHLSGLLGNLTSVKSALTLASIRSIKNIYFDWFRMPSAYVIESLYTKSVFTELLPWLAENSLEIGGTLWFPGFNGMYKLLQTHLDILATFYDVFFDYDVANNMLYSASSEVLDEYPLPQVLQSLPDQDQYMKESSHDKPMFIKLVFHGEVRRRNIIAHKVSVVISAFISVYIY